MRFLPATRSPGEGCLGCSPQEKFYGCVDVNIKELKTKIWTKPHFSIFVLFSIGVLSGIEPFLPRFGFLSSMLCALHHSWMRFVQLHRWCIIHWLKQTRYFRLFLCCRHAQFSSDCAHLNREKQLSKCYPNTWFRYFHYPRLPLVNFYREISANYKMGKKKLQKRCAK